MRSLALTLAVALAGCGVRNNGTRGAPAPPVRGYADRCGYTDVDQDTTASTFYAVSGAKRRPFMAVAKLEITTGVLCSSVLIAPDELLTSAHCFEGDGAVKRVAFDDPLAASSVAAQPASVKLHPEYQAALQRDETLATAAGLASVDLAVVKLKGSLTEPVPVPTAAVDPASGLLSRGKLVALVGYGDTGRGAGTKRFAQSHVGRLLSGATIGGQTFDNLMLLDSLSGTGACPGDSGGGVFVKAGEGYVLVGIVNGVNDVLYPGFPLATCAACPRGIGIVTLVAAAAGIME